MDWKVEGTVTRELKEREKAVLERYLAMEKPPREPKGPWLGCLIISVILGGLAHFFWGGRTGVVLLVCCLLGLVVVAFLGKENFRWRSTRMGVEEKLIEALEEKRVEVMEVRASDVVVEIHDQGPRVYYFDVGDHRVLRVEVGSVHWPVTDPGDGRALYVESDGERWPNNHFEIVRTIRERLWVGVFCLGEGIDPVRRINTFEEDPLVLKCGSPVALFMGSLDRVGGTPVAEW